MQLDPYLHLQMHEQELRRKMTQNALEREARAARAATTPVRAGQTRQPSLRPGKLTALAAALASVTRSLGIGRHGI